MQPRFVRSKNVQDVLALGFVAKTGVRQLRRTDASQSERLHSTGDGLPQAHALRKFSQAPRASFQHGVHRGIEVGQLIKFIRYTQTGHGEVRRHQLLRKPDRCRDLEVDPRYAGGG
jgi:hypothetical protein